MRHSAEFTSPSKIASAGMPVMSRLQRFARRAVRRQAYVLSLLRIPKALLSLRCGSKKSLNVSPRHDVSIPTKLAHVLCAFHVNAENRQFGFSDSKKELAFHHAARFDFGDSKRLNKISQTTFGKVRFLDHLTIRTSVPWRPVKCANGRHTKNARERAATLK